MSVPLMKNRLHVSRAFSLLEMMMVVALVSVLATLAIGYAGSYASDQRVKQTARGVQASINLARAYAVRNNRTVKVVFGLDKVTAFVDADNDNIFDTGETSVYQYPDNNAVLPATVAMNMQSMSYRSDMSSMQLNGSGRPFININSEGLSFSSYNTALISITICISDTASDEVRAVQMTATSTCRIFFGAQAKALGCKARTGRYSYGMSA